MKKRFPRFSLRALVIAVLGIAVCWSLTATRGVADVADEIGSSSNRTRIGNTVNVSYTDQNGEEVECAYVAKALLPFYITVKVQVRYHGGIHGDHEFADSASFFWFFGYKLYLTKDNRKK